MQTYPDHVVRPISEGWCAFPVDLGLVFLPVRHEHVRHALLKGVEPTVCARAASVEIDGAAYCREHAGEVLIRAALDENAGS